MNFKLSEIFGKAQRALTKYPLTLLLSLIMTVTAIYLVENNYKNVDENYIATKILMVAALGISLSFALRMLSQRNPKYSFLEFLLLPFLVGYYFLFPANEDDFNEKFAFLLIPSYVMAHLLVAFVPYLKKENSETDFWEYNKKLFVNFFLTVIFTGVLCGGIELAIAAVDHLFTMDFDGNRYFETFLFFLIFGSTFIFALFNIEGLKSLEKKTDYPVVLKFFTQFILIPLLIIYLVILYLYSLKILINWELPRGWVSYLVLVYSVLGILALLLVHPLKEQTEKSWVRMFSKIFYYTLIPLLVLLFVAIFTRVLEYGFTEARYFVLLLAIWLSSIFVYFTFYAKSTIKFIPVSLFVFGLFALIFPYLNAFSVAKNSQKNDLVRILIENNLLKDGKIDFSQEVKLTVVSQIEDKFDFLDNRNQRDYLTGFLSEKQLENLPKKNYRYWNFRNEFKEVIKDEENPEYQANYIRLNNLKSVYETEDYDYIILSEKLNEDEVNLGEDKLKLDRTDTQFKLSLNHKETVDLQPQIQQFFDDYIQLSNNNDVEDLSIETQIGSYTIKIVFDSIHCSKYSGEGSYWYSGMYFLIKKSS